LQRKLPENSKSISSLSPLLARQGQEEAMKACYIFAGLIATTGVHLCSCFPLVGYNAALGELLARDEGKVETYSIGHVLTDLPNRRARLLAAKAASGKTWDEISRELGLQNAYTCQV
jgi:hypothetical protein